MEPAPAAPQRAGGHLRDHQLIESWVAPVTATLVEAGADEPTARADARLGLAVVRGLLLDLLATGDRAGTTAAHERFLQLASATGAPTRAGD